MRILHVIGTLNPRSGGPAASVATLHRFREKATHCEVVTLDDPGADFLSDLGFPATALGTSAFRYGYTPTLIPWLIANGDRFDGVIVHGLWQYCGYAVLRAFGRRKPYMVFVHGMLDPYFKNSYPSKHLKKWIYWLFVEYWVLRGAYRVLFTCEEEERLAAESFWLHRWIGHVIPLGTALPEGEEMLRRQSFLDLFPELEHRRYLLFLGRIDRKKGCDLLIAAFIRAAALDPMLDLVLAGPDEHNWRVELAASLSEAGVASRVHWTGMLHTNEKWGALACCEAFILPSHQENFGIAVAEALACGRPVLLSDKVNIASDVALAGAGLIDRDTEDGAFRLISAWIQMPSKHRLAMANAAHDVFESRYDMRNNAREIDKLLHQALLIQHSPLAVSASAVE